MDREKYQALIKGDMQSINLYARNNLVGGEGSFATSKAEDLMELMFLLSYYQLTGDSSKNPLARKLMDSILDGKQQWNTL